MLSDIASKAQVATGARVHAHLLLKRRAQVPRPQAVGDARACIKKLQ